MEDYSAVGFFSSFELVASRDLKQTGLYLCIVSSFYFSGENSFHHHYVEPNQDTWMSILLPIKAHGIIRSKFLAWFIRTSTPTDPYEKWHVTPQSSIKIDLAKGYPNLPDSQACHAPLGSAQVGCRAQSNLTCFAHRMKLHSGIHQFDDCLTAEHRETPIITIVVVSKAEPGRRGFFYALTEFACEMILV